MPEPGAIPASTTPSTSLDQLESISRANQRRRRTWKELGRLPFDFARPYSFSEAMVRIKRNLSYFCVNYAVIMLMINFQVILWHHELHTFLMIVFSIVYLGWIFLYFYRDEPLVVFNHTFDYSLVLIMSSVFTVVVIGFGHLLLKVLLVSLPIGALEIGLHALFRVTDDLYLNEQEAAHEGLLLVV